MNNEIVTKKCTKCNNVKSTSEFYIRKVALDGFNSECKQCNNEKTKSYRKSKDGFVAVVYLKQIRNSKKRCMVLPAYSKEDLKEWLFKQNLFHDLHKNWKDSGYDRNLAPSVDRKDDYKSYTIGNIQLMTWSENLLKGARDRVLGINNKKNKAVMQLDIDGNKVQEYYSMAEAGRQTGICDSHINQVCTGKRNHAGGYNWKFKESVRK